MAKNLNIIIFFILFSLFNIQCMTYDNRHFPLYFKPYIHRTNRIQICRPDGQLDECLVVPSHFRVQPLFMRAERSFADLDETGLPEINGSYDLASIIKALQITGKITSNPLRSDLRIFPTFPFKREGRVDAEGMAFSYEQYLGKGFSFGTSFLFLHIASRHEFFIDPSCFSNIQFGDQQYLFLLKDRLDCDLGVIPPIFNKSVFGDGDFYLRWGQTWEYTCKFRQIDLGFSLGLLAPFSPRAEINNPASIPLGDNKRWGVYFRIDNDLELKEDWHVGYLFQINKRFARTFNFRMPVDTEPLDYGAEIGAFRINPGITVAFSPYVTFEDLQDGLGARIYYTLVYHAKDSITDQRANRNIPVNFQSYIDKSSWSMEHVTLQGFYDFSKIMDRKCYLPIISVAWDIPVQWLSAKRSYKTNCISLMFEFDF